MPCVDYMRKRVIRVMMRKTYGIGISWPLMKVATQNKTTDYREFESLVLDEITDGQKSKHLDTDQHAGFRKGDWLGMIKVIQNIVSRPSITPSKPKFDFKIEEEAAQKNSVILEHYVYGMARVIAGNKGSTIWYGSEFRLPNEIV
eukprot:6440641-Ditylum_brightwellii.AAC.1